MRRGWTGLAGLQLRLGGPRRAQHRTDGLGDVWRAALEGLAALLLSGEQQAELRPVLARLRERLLDRRRDRLCERAARRDASLAEVAVRRRGGAHVQADPRAAQRRLIGRRELQWPTLQAEARALPPHLAQPSDCGAVGGRLAVLRLDRLVVEVEQQLQWRADLW